MYDNPMTARTRGRPMQFTGGLNTQKTLATATQTWATTSAMIERRTA